MSYYDDYDYDWNNYSADYSAGETILAGASYYVLPGAIKDAILSGVYDNVLGADPQGAFAVGLLKDLIWSGIVFGGILGTMWGVANGRLNDAKDAFVDKTNQTTQVLRENIRSVDFAGENLQPQTFTVDTKNGKITGVITYDGIDKDGDKARYFGRFEADCDKDVLKDYTVKLKNYNDKVQYYINEAKKDSYNKTEFLPNVRNFNNEIDTTKVEYWSTISNQTESVNAVKTVANELSDSMYKMFAVSQNYQVEKVAKVYDFNKNLLKNALYTNPTLVSDVNGSVSGLFTSGSVKTDLVQNGTMLLNVSKVEASNESDSAKFYVDYIEKSGKAAQFRQAKVFVDTKDYDATKCSLEEYVYNAFIDETKQAVKSFSQNQIKEANETVEDDYVVVE